MITGIQVFSYIDKKVRSYKRRRAVHSNECTF